MRAQELRRAVADCRARGLYTAAKWAAATLCGLPEEEVMGSSQELPAAGGGSGGTSAAFDLARSLFDLKVRGCALRVAVLCRTASMHAAAAGGAMRSQKLGRIWVPVALLCCATAPTEPTHRWFAACPLLPEPSPSSFGCGAGVPQRGTHAGRRH